MILLFYTRGDEVVFVLLVVIAVSTLWLSMISVIVLSEMTQLVIQELRNMRK